MVSWIQIRFFGVLSSWVLKSSKDGDFPYCLGYQLRCLSSVCCGVMLFFVLDLFVFFIQLEPPISILHHFPVLTLSISVKNLAPTLRDLLLSIGRLVLGCLIIPLWLFSLRLKNPSFLRFSLQVMCSRHWSPCWLGFLKLLTSFLIQEGLTLGAVFQVWSNEGIAKENPRSLFFPQCTGYACHSPGRCIAQRMLQTRLASCSPEPSGSFQQSSSPASQSPMCADAGKLS